jgi:hypothetical protein
VIKESAAIKESVAIKPHPPAVGADSEWQIASTRAGEESILDP